MHPPRPHLRPDFTGNGAAQQPPATIDFALSAADKLGRLRRARERLIGLALAYPQTYAHLHTERLVLASDYLDGEADEDLSVVSMAIVEAVTTGRRMVVAGSTRLASHDIGLPGRLYLDAVYANAIARLRAAGYCGADDDGLWSSRRLASLAVIARTEVALYAVGNLLTDASTRNWPRPTILRQIDQVRRLMAPIVAAREAFDAARAYARKAERILAGDETGRAA